MTRPVWWVCWYSTKKRSWNSSTWTRPGADAVSGDRFIDLAKQQRPNGLALWTFQVNTPAQRFYRRHGFVATERTDGSRNEEREPDIRFVWKPSPTRLTL